MTSLAGPSGKKISVVVVEAEYIDIVVGILSALSDNGFILLNKPRSTL